MIVFGQIFRPTRYGRSLHRLEGRTWPARYVVFGTAVGWNECELCSRWHRIWLTDDRTWRRLPRQMRKMRMCTICFRESVKR